MIKVSTFCSGIGSAEEALKNLGVEHEVVFASEIDKYARLSYQANHDAKLMINDMCEPDYVGEQYYSDLNISGLPCQSFSLAGKRLGELDKRGVLFYDFYRWVKNQQPKVFIIENVKGLLSADKGVIFQNWLLLLGRSVNSHEQMFIHPDSLEYNLHYTVLNSKNFGVPQNRERVFIVGIRKDLPNDFRFPIGWKLDKRLRDILETNVEEKYYLSGKMLEMLETHSDRHTEKGTGFAVKFKSESDIANCLRANAALCPTDNILKLGFINQDTQASQVYGTDGISPTLSAGTHGYALGYINEPFCVAMRGRNPDNPSDITTGANLQQTLESNSQGITNTLTSVQKDNLIVEPQLTQIAQIDGFESEGRVYDANGLARTIKDGGGGGSKTGWYAVGEDWVVGGLQQNQTPRTDGICPTLTSAMGMGGGQIPIVKQAVIEPQIFQTPRGFNKGGLHDICPSITSNSFEHNNHLVEAQVVQLNDSKESGGKQPYKQNRIYHGDGISPVLDTECGRPNYLVGAHIRRLTPLECFRLQGYSDEFFYKCQAVNSDTQLYKQAGNTITVSVIQAIITNLLHILN